MSTWLQAVSEQEMEELERDPGLINRLDKPRYVRTHFSASINYFVTGAAYPGPDHHPLWSMLDGGRSVACATLENGAFGLVSPTEAGLMARLVAEVDLADVVARIESADLDDLIGEEELEDLELIDQDEAPTVIVNDLKELTRFYADVAAERLGVVMYTT